LLRSSRDQDEKGLSFRQLVAAFLVVVALCAVFFSLGFCVVYKARSSNAAPVTETITPRPDAPAPVSAPSAETSASSAETGVPTTSAANNSAQTQQAESEVDEPSPEPNPPLSGTRRPSAAPPPQAVVARDSTAPVRPDSGGFTVQVAALSNRQDAESLASVLKTRGYTAFLMTPEQAGAHDKFFRVAVGPFRSKDDATKAVGKLGDEGFKPFIKR